VRNSAVLNDDTAAAVVEVSQTLELARAKRERKRRGRLCSRRYTPVLRPLCAPSVSGGSPRGGR
jgi:hypothetical protein